jgi:hypothetical protein
VGEYDGNAATRDILATTDGTTFRVDGQLPVAVRYAALSAVGHALYTFGGEWAGTESDAVQAFETHTGRASSSVTFPSRGRRGPQVAGWLGVRSKRCARPSRCGFPIW